MNSDWSRHMIENGIPLQTEEGGIMISTQEEGLDVLAKSQKRIVIKRYSML